MSDGYIGEIRMFGGNFPPLNWKFCDGSLQSIADYDALYSLIGTTYGGDGQTTFGLPDLRGRVPVHMGRLAGGNSYSAGQKAGVESVTLSGMQTAQHTHPVIATGTSPSPSPQNALFATATGGKGVFYTYAATAPDTGLASSSVTPSQGGNQPHANLQPSLGVNFIISMFGIYPSPS